MAFRGRGRGFFPDPENFPAAPSQQPQPQLPIGRGRGFLETITTPGEYTPRPPQQIPQVVGRGRGALQFLTPTPEVTTAQPQASLPTVLPPVLGRGRGAFQIPPATAAAAPSLAGPGGDAHQGAVGPAPGKQSSPEPPTQEMASLAVASEPVSRPGCSGKKFNASANYVKLNTEPGKGIFEYEVKFDPVIDGRNIRFKCLNQHLERLGGTRTFDGTILYLPIKLPEEVTTLVSTHPADNSPVTLKVIFKKQKLQRECIHFYNILFRNIMKELKLVQFGRQHYDAVDKKLVPQYKLEIWPGYVTSVDEFEGGVLLNCDASHRVLRSETIWDLMQDAARKNVDFRDAVSKEVIGLTVLTRYNNRLYRVDDIDWSKSPTTEFTTHRGETLTFMSYYQQQYDLKITSLKQPLLISRVKKRKGEDKNAAEVICLIPELCTITGLTDPMKNDFKLMKDLSQHTRLTPNSRQRSLKAFVRNIQNTPNANRLLKNWGLSLDESTVELYGRILDCEEIFFHNDSTLAGNTADWGGPSTRSKVLTSIDLTNWVIIHVRNDSSIAKRFEETMQKVAPAMGIFVEKPRSLALQNDKVESYLRALEETIQPSVQIVVTLCPTIRSDRYAAIKKFCCSERPVASQVINTKTLMKQERVRSVVQKIALQMNCKLGGTLWKVKIPMKQTMVCGFDAYHDPGSKGTSVAAFVSSFNDDYTRWFSKCVIQGPRQEIADAVKNCFDLGLRQYKKVNGVYPSKIFFYRDGVGDGQLKTSKNYEIPQLEAAFKEIASDYKPQLVFVVCQKRINTRIFKYDRAHNGEITYDNPGPGSIMDHTVTRRNYYDFFLVSQHVRQGTVSPTHYVVVEDTSTMSPDHVQRLTFKLTHLYYNWPGTIRVPAPCQYAHKLAQLVGQSIKREPSAILADRLYFL